MKPVASGSGVPEIKCYLNGVKVGLHFTWNLRVNHINHASDVEGSWSHETHCFLRKVSWTCLQYSSW